VFDLCQLFLFVSEFQTHTQTHTHTRL